MNRISHILNLFPVLICNGWERPEIRLTNSFICPKTNDKNPNRYLSSLANSFIWMSRLMQNYIHLMAFCCLVAVTICNLHMRATKGEQIIWTCSRSLSIQNTKSLNSEQRTPYTQSENAFQRHFPKMWIFMRIFFTTRKVIN